MSMGDRIKEQRELKGWTQEELGKYLGKQKSIIAKYENGHVANIKRDTIQKMAELFNVRPSYLMALDEEETGGQDKLMQIVEKLNEEKLNRLLSYAKYLEQEDTK